MAEFLDAGAVAGLSMPATVRFQPRLQPICGACSSQFSMLARVYYSTPALKYLQPVEEVFHPGVGRKPMPGPIEIRPAYSMGSAGVDTLPKYSYFVILSQLLLS